MKIELFNPKDIETLELQKAQEQFKEDLKCTDYVKSLQESGLCYSLKNDANVTLAIVGLSDKGFGKAYGWTLISQNIGRYLAVLTQAIKKYLKTTPYRRIYIRVHKNFTEGIIWASKLGFICEGIEYDYLDGHDFIRFAWLRKRCA